MSQGEVSEIVTGSLKKVARGTIIAFLGIAATLILGFVGRTIVARYTSEANYGIFSMALVLLSIAVVLSTLGLEDGCARFIAYFMERKEEGKAQKTISFALQLTFLASIFFSLALFLASDVISHDIFHMPRLSLTLKIFATVVPCYTLSGILASIFRGFGRIEEKACFYDTLRSGLFPLLLIPVVFLGLSFTAINLVYLASVVITALVFLFYAFNKSPLPIKLGRIKDANPLAKELLSFSLPLVGANALIFLVAWTDTLLLGHYQTSEVVGLYSAAQPIAHFIFTPLGTVMLIFVPVAAGLYSQNHMAEIRRTYAIITKWITSLIFPIFIVFLLFPQAVIHLLFGTNYTAASIALQIFSVGYFIDIVLGPNSTLLMVLGRTQFLMWTNLLGLAANVLLCVLLIPAHGMMGAAIASSASVVLVGIVCSVKLYSVSRTHPFRKNLLKPLGAILIISIPFALLAKGTSGNISLWVLPFIFLSFYGLYLLCLLFTRSFDREDITMLLTIEKRLGFNLSPVKRVLARFL